MKKSRHPFLKWAGIVFLVLGLVYAGLVVAGNMAVRREKAALEAAGFPTRPERVIPAAIPEKDNAAPLYNAAVKALQDVPFEGESVGGVTVTSSNLFDQLGQAAVAFLKAPDDVKAAQNFETLVRDPRVTEFISGIERASALPGYRQDVDYTKGPEIRLPYISDNLRVSQILAALALQQTRQGDTAAAWRTIEISFRFADTLRDEPLIISQLVRKSQQSIAIKAMKDAAAMSAPSEDVSQTLQKHLSLIDGEMAATLALNGDRILFSEWACSQSPASLGRFMRKWSEKVPFPYSSDLTSVVFGPLLQPWDNAAFLKICRIIITGGDKAIRENHSSSYLRSIPGLFALTKWVIPSVQVGGLMTELTRVESSALVSRLGLAAINYMKEHGAFPRDLQALGAQDLVDPSSGQPLVYRPEPDGFLLYSLGPDLTDDGGREYDHKKRKGDIVWRYQEGSGDSDATSG